jgi:hypothetical protein
MIEIYLACDLSAGSERYVPLLEVLTTEFSRSPLLQEYVHLHLIGFSPDAQIFASFAGISSDESLSFPAVARSTATGYAASFRLVSSAIEQEAQQSPGPGEFIHRLILIVIGVVPPTAGDELWTPHQELMAIHRHLNVIGISLGEEASRTVARIATVAAFSATEVESISKLIVDIMRNFFNTRIAGDIRLAAAVTYIEGITLLDRPDSAAP